MKKFVKMSLVAAVAVAGLTTANAASLEESIKNIDVSGSARLRFNQSAKTANTDDYTRFGWTADFATKVSDDVTVTTSFYAKDASPTNIGNNGTLNDVSVQYNGINVTYTGIANTTAIIGQQALGTPFTVASDLTGVDQTGNGILVVNSSTPVTLIGGYMDSNTAFKGEMFIVGAKGSVAGLGLQAWYAKQQVEAVGQAELTFYKATYGVTVSDVKLGAAVQYATGKVTGEATEAITQAKVTAAMGMFDAEIRYLGNNKAAGTTLANQVAYDGTAEAMGFEGVIVHGNSAGDGQSAMRYAVNAKVLPSVKVGLAYDTVDTTATNTDTETRAYAKWTMAKGTSLTAYAGSAEVSKKSDAFTRIQLDYKF